MVQLGAVHLYVVLLRFSSRCRYYRQPCGAWTSPALVNKGYLASTLPAIPVNLAEAEDFVSDPPLHGFNQPVGVVIIGQKRNCQIVIWIARY